MGPISRGGIADLLIVIRKPIRDIRLEQAPNVEGFKNNKIIYHVDCDESEINNRVKECIPIVADIELFLHTAISRFSDTEFPQKLTWIDEIDQLKIQWPDTAELAKLKGINPNYFMHCLSGYSAEVEGFVADVGNHQMWAAQSLMLIKGQILHDFRRDGCNGICIAGCNWG